MNTMPLNDAYGFIHAWMAEQGIECITPAEKARREAEADAMMERARNF